ncbi:MAG: hypothetical protein BMS9Abin20_0107 [Acidimicrobiia bacterium]|nr:MAG: hypothetical protein BMS9Abin20_0107 [Acidimicrobiia bacterium]
MTDDTLISPELLAIMQCPRCAGELAEQTDPPALVCQDCGHAYPVVDGIPNMIVDD